MTGGSEHMAAVPGRGDEVAWRLEMSRRKVLKGMLAAAGVAAAGAGVSSWLTQGPARAAGAILPPGTRPDPTKPEGTDLLPQIEHIVIYMQENQSYDHYFGTLGKGDGFTIGAGGLPTNTNLDAQGNPVTVHHVTDTCDAISGDHSWNGTHQEWNQGAMDGFAKVSGPNVMGYYDETNLPFYRGLADTFPLCDRWFSSVLGPTYPNRRFLQAATSIGIVSTDTNEVLATPTAPNGTIWDRLLDHGITWADYAIDIWDILLFPNGPFLDRSAPNRKFYADFLADCTNGTLPQVSILAPGGHDQYDEGSQDVQNGEAFSASIINSIMNSSCWPTTAILFTWDEHGGGYDHVPPPAAVAPDDIAPRITVPPDQPGDFAQYGIRVPGFVISPWSRAGGYVSHVVHDHTSVLKFIETKFNLGAMTYRDANADDLLDCFDFSRPQFLDPPPLPEPGLPATGSACQPQPREPTAPKSPTTTTTTTTSPSTTAPAGSSTTGPGGGGAGAGGTGTGAGGTGAGGGSGGTGAGATSTGPAAPVSGPVSFTG